MQVDRLGATDGREVEILLVHTDLLAVERRCCDGGGKREKNGKVRRHSWGKHRDRESSSRPRLLEDGEVDGPVNETAKKAKSKKSNESRKGVSLRARGTRRQAAEDHPVVVG